MDQKINSLLDQAEDHLSKAQENLCRPEEDVVPYSICKHAHGAIIYYLSAFIMRNGRELPEAKTVESMLPLCREISPKFNDLHLAPFYHPTDTADVWMNLDTANDFLKMAKQTKSVVQLSLSDNYAL